jgi:hypothetical protein
MRDDHGGGMAAVARRHRNPSRRSEGSLVAEGSGFQVRVAHPEELHGIWMRAQRVGLPARSRELSQGASAVAVRYLKSG